MAPDRFDDVEFRFVEDPEPPRRPPSLRRRMTIALSTWILAAGVLAAGASALTDSDGTAAAAGNAEAKTGRTAEGVPFKRDGRECDRAHQRRDSAFAPSDF